MAIDPETATKGMGVVGALTVGIPSMFAGLIISLISLIILVAGVGDGIKKYRANKDAARYTVAYNGPKTEGKLVHLSGLLETDMTLVDSQLSISVDSALALRRVVSYYQWLQKDTSFRVDSSQLGRKEYLFDSASTMVRAIYRLEPRANEVSTSFYKGKWYQSNEKIHRPLTSRTLTASRASLEGLLLGNAFIRQTEYEHQLPLEPVTKALMIDSLLPVKTKKGYFYGKDAANPALGDFLVNYTYTPNHRVSVIGEQGKRRITPHETKRGGTVAMLESGNKGLEEMITMSNIFLIFGLFIGTFLVAALMKIGMFLVVKPIRLVAFIISPELYEPFMLVDKILTWGIFVAIIGLHSISIFFA